MPALSETMIASPDHGWSVSPSRVVQVHEPVYAGAPITTVGASQIPLRGGYRAITRLDNHPSQIGGPHYYETKLRHPQGACRHTFQCPTRLYAIRGWQSAGTFKRVQ